MTVEKETDQTASTTNLASGASSLTPLAFDQDSLDLELQAAASEIESLAVEFENVKVEDQDQFVMVVLPPEDPKPEEEAKEGEKEEVNVEAPPPQKTWKDWLIDLLPVCPPPVCGVLKEQLITFTAMVVVGMFFFLIYWFVE